MRWLVILALAVVACGPIQSTQQIISAKNEVEQAKRQRAYLTAPYEYTKAWLMLRMAKQRQMRSEFEGSINFANESETYAKRAMEIPQNPRVLKLRLKYDKEFQKLYQKAKKGEKK